MKSRSQLIRLSSHVNQNDFYLITYVNPVRVYLTFLFIIRCAAVIRDLSDILPFAVVFSCFFYLSFKHFLPKFPKILYCYKSSVYYYYQFLIVSLMFLC